MIVNLNRPLRKDIIVNFTYIDLTATGKQSKECTANHIIHCFTYNVNNTSILILHNCHIHC